MSRTQAVSTSVFIATFKGAHARRLFLPQRSQLLPLPLLKAMTVTQAISVTKFIATFE
jgi:hypothetical protein